MATSALFVTCKGSRGSRHCDAYVARAVQALCVCVCVRECLSYLLLEQRNVGPKVATFYFQRRAASERRAALKPCVSLAMGDTKVSLLESYLVGSAEDGIRVWIEVVHYALSSSPQLRTLLSAREVLQHQVACVRPAQPPPPHVLLGFGVLRARTVAPSGPQPRREAVHTHVSRLVCVRLGRPVATPGSSTVRTADGLSTARGVRTPL